MTIPNSSLSQSELSRLRSYLHEHFQAKGIYQSIKSAISSFIGKKNFEDALKPLDSTTDWQQESLAEIMVEFLLKNTRATFNIPPDGNRLMLKILSGSNFSEMNGDIICFAIVFGPNRMITNPVRLQQASAVFNEEIVFGLGPKSKFNNQVSLNQLLQCSEKLQFILLKENPETRIRTILSAKEIEWREALVSGSDHFSIEFLGREESLLPMPIGTLNIFLKVLPALTSESFFGDSARIHKFLSDNWLQKSESVRKFQVFVKDWWGEYIHIRRDHEQRAVKLFICNENNEKRFLCSMVEPIYDNRILPSPMHACRFVSMIPVSSENFVGGERSASWASLSAFLSRGHGSVEEHSLLLCSFLLGFGIDAYVCCGTNANGPYVWVLSKESAVSILFWDSITGTTVSLQRTQKNESERKRFPFRTIGCVFSHEEYFANIQIDNAVLSTSWDLHNSSYWKSIPKEMIHWWPRTESIKILPCNIDPAAVSESLDAELKRFTEDYRLSHLNADTKWDDHLGSSFSQALAAYESQFITGKTFGNSLFQQAIKNLIPLHHAFRAYPVHFDHMDAKKIMNHLKSEVVPSEILHKVGLSVSFALRSYIVPYAEHVAITWVMIAVKWRE